MPSTEPVIAPPPVTDWSAASTVSAGGLSEALDIEYAPAAVAPTAIAATISRPLSGTPSSLRCSAAPAADVDDVGGGHAVADVGVAVAVARATSAARSRASGRNCDGTASRSGIRSSVSCRSSSSGACMTCDSRSNALLSRNSRSARSPNSLNGMMSVISAASGGIFGVMRAVWWAVRSSKLRAEMRDERCRANLECPSGRDQNVIETRGR